MESEGNCGSGQPKATRDPAIRCLTCNNPVEEVHRFTEEGSIFVYPCQHKVKKVV